ncbi:MAG: ATP-dependent zinc metalloprotease FtsH [Pseudomonadota bacterium]
MADQDPKDELPPNWISQVLFAALLGVLVFAIILRPDQMAGFTTVPYSDFKSRIVDGEFQSVEIAPTEITGVSQDGSTQRMRALLPPVEDEDLLPMLEDAGVEVTGKPATGGGALAWILPWLLILGFYFWISRRMMMNMPGAAGGMGGLFSGRFMKPAEQREKITFADVAGQDAAKKEVAELVEFLQDFERFERVGAEVPHGVLLTGPPGTGKTLLARALAGEAGVPFFSTSGSEFIEVFVGVGAGRVRRLFEEARKQAPSVIFIDELDSIGRTRGTGLGGGHDEREQTLNQILAELDGFSGKEAVVVLAATNRPDVLDAALLRPGRFDRHVALTLPDKSARRAILQIHAKGRPLAHDADLDQVAAGTPGFSGADLENLLNEAAIRAARRSAAEISPLDLDDARDRIMMGTVRTLAIQPAEKHRLAIHEAGHTAAAFFTPKADPIYKVTIIPRGHALGGTHMLPEEERHTLEEGYLRAQLITLLAGRVAEQVFLNEVSSGADDDIRRATGLARNMVARWGMSKKLGPIDLRTAEDHPFLGQSIAQPRDHSDTTAALVDEEVVALLRESETTARRVIEENRPQMERLVERLEAEETLDREAITECLAPDDTVTPLRPRNAADP